MTKRKKPTLKKRPGVKPARTRRAPTPCVLDASHPTHVGPCAAYNGPKTAAVLKRRAMATRPSLVRRIHPITGAVIELLDPATRQRDPFDGRMPVAMQKFGRRRPDAKA